MTNERLVSPCVAPELAETLQAQTLNATADELANERDLVRLFIDVDDGTDAVPQLVRAAATQDRSSSGCCVAPSAIEAASG